MRNMRAILMILAALLYAGTASAYSITVVDSAGGTSVMPTDILTADIVVDTQGDQIYGFTFLVEFDPGVLSPVGGTLNLPGTLSEYSSLYLYPSSWYILAAGLSGPTAAGVYTIANLVFHVMDVAPSTVTSIDPTFNAPYSNFVVQVPPVDVMGSVALNGASIHVPEPTTTMLMGLGLFGILYAGRRR